MDDLTRPECPHGVETAALISVLDCGGHARVAIGAGGGVWHHDSLSDCRNVLDVVRDWSRVGTDVSALLSGPLDAARPLPDARITRLLAYPPKIQCSGPNYHHHLAEMSEAALGDAWTPYFFLKPPKTTVRAPGEPFEMTSEADRVDWEGELAVVVGLGGRDIPPSMAHRHIAGYTVAKDISLRGPHRRQTPAAPFQWDWVASKAADGSLPLGPGLGGPLGAAGLLRVDPGSGPSCHASHPKSLRATAPVNTSPPR